MTQEAIEQQSEQLTPKNQDDIVRQYRDELRMAQATEDEFLICRRPSPMRRPDISVSTEMC